MSAQCSWPLTRQEMAVFRDVDLAELHFEDYLDNSSSPVHRILLRFSRVEVNARHWASNGSHPCKPWQEYGHDADKNDKDNHNFHEANRSLRNELPPLHRIHKR